MECSTKQAMDYIVPVTKAVPKVVEALRDAAHGTMISAATGKVYDKGQAGKAATGKSRRVKVS